MRPALSVILLTTLIGAGQGLFLALFTVESYAAFGLLARQTGAFYGAGAAIALGLLVAGLAASFFHLGHPERAWRSAARWRTSWLSREVIVLPAFMAVVVLYGLAHWAGINPVLVELPSGAPVDVTAILGVAGTLLAFALYVSTAMIYACLRFLQEWHTPLTVSNYVLLGGASGFTLASAFAAIAAPGLAPFFAGWAIVLTALGLVSRAASSLRNGRLKAKSSPQTAIGARHPRVRQISQGFLGGSFNTREFFHGRAPGVLSAVKWLFLLLAFVVPLVLLATALVTASKPGLVAAFAVQYLGMLAERWFFFAQANHPQNLYYQAVS